MIGSVIFIGTLLLMAGIEPNPGPLPDEKSEDVSKDNACENDKELGTHLQSLQKKDNTADRTKNLEYLDMGESKSSIEEHNTKDTERASQQTTLDEQSTNRSPQISNPKPIDSTGAVCLENKIDESKSVEYLEMGESKSSVEEQNEKDNKSQSQQQLLDEQNVNALPPTSNLKPIDPTSSVCLENKTDETKTVDIGESKNSNEEQNAKDTDKLSQQTSDEQNTNTLPPTSNPKSIDPIRLVPLEKKIDESKSIEYLEMEESKSSVEKQNEKDTESQSQQQFLDEQNANALPPTSNLKPIDPTGSACLENRTNETKNVDIGESKSPNEEQSAKGTELSSQQTSDEQNTNTLPPTSNQKSIDPIRPVCLENKTDESKSVEYLEMGESKISVEEQNEKDTESQSQQQLLDDQNANALPPTSNLKLIDPTGSVCLENKTDETKTVDIGDSKNSNEEQNAKVTELSSQQTSDEQNTNTLSPTSNPKSIDPIGLENKIDESKSVEYLEMGESKISVEEQNEKDTESQSQQQLLDKQNANALPSTSNIKPIDPRENTTDGTKTLDIGESKSANEEQNAKDTERSSQQTSDKQNTNMLPTTSNPKSIDPIRLVPLGSKENREKKTTNVMNTHDTVLKKFQLEKWFPGKIKLQDVMQIIGDNEIKNHSDIPWLVLRKIIMLDFRARDILLSESIKQVKQSTKVESQTRPRKQQNPFLEKSEAINPLDFFLVLFSCCDHSLQQTLVEKLYTCHLAIPFCIVQSSTQTLQFPFWCIRGLEIEYFSKEKGTNLSTIDLPMNIVSFIRLNRPSLSKSKYLNLVLNEEPHQTFLDNECSFGKSKKILSNGLLEAAWFLPSGKETQIFSKLLMFLNLRGNAKDHKNQLEMLTSISCVFVVFINIEDLKCEYFETLEQIHKSNAPVIHVLTSSESNENENELLLAAYEERIQKMKQNTEDLSIVYVSDDITICDIKIEIRNSINDCLNGSSRKMLSDVKKTTKQLGIECDEDSIGCAKGKTLAEKVISTIENVTLEKIKGETVPIQVNYWEKYTTLLKQNHKSSESVNNTTDIASRMDEALEQVANISKTFTPFMDVFTEVILDATLDSQTISYFIQWLKYFLNDRSKKQLPVLREKYHKAWQEVKKAEEKNDKAKIEHKKELANAAERALADASFGFEHIVREMGHYFEAAYLNSKPQNWEKIKLFPEFTAKLLISGQSMELMDGDTASVPINWVKAVMDETRNVIGNVNVIALSIVGIQSSGKSTLLNTMFGLKFSVNAGRCTRGIYMQLIKVHDNCKLKNVEYVLILDTEGLRAPELADKKHDHDNELATFVIGLGDITIVNIKGENYSEIQNILQIVVHAFIRLRLANKSLNLNKACAFIYQNVSTVNAAEQLRQGQQKLVDILNEMTVQAAEEENIADIYLFKQVINFDPGEHTWYFSDLWRGDPPMAPSNTGYSEHCEKVKKRLVGDIIKGRIGYITLSSMTQHIVDLWNGILGENFVFGFRNSLEIKAYNEMENMYMRLIWSQESLLAEWTQKKALECNRYDTSHELVEFIHQLRNECKKLAIDKQQEIMVEFEQFFESHQLKNISMQWKDIKLADMNMRTTQLIIRTCTEISNIESQKILDLKTRKTQGLHQAQINTEAEKLASQFKGEKQSEKELRDIFDDMFDEWQKELQDVPITFEPVIKTIKSYLTDKLSSDSLILTSTIGVYPLEQELQHEHLNGSLCVTDMSDDFISVKNFLKRLTNPMMQYADKYKKVVLNRINVLFQSIDIKLHHYMMTNDKFRPSFVNEILQILLNGINEYNSNKDEKCTITTKGKMFVIVHAFRFARPVFEKMNARFEESHGLKSKLKLYKKTAWKLFKDIVEKKSEEEIFTTQFCDCIYEPIKETVSKSIPNKVVDKIVQEKFTNTKQQLIFHILDKLANKEDFTSYMEYISHPYLFALNLVTENTNVMLFNGPSFQYRKWAELHIQQIISDLKICISKATNIIEKKKDLTVNDWLQDVKGRLEHLVIPSMTMHHLLNQKRYDFQSIEKLLMKKTESLQKHLEDHYMSITMENIKWDSPTPYKSVMDRIWGCEAQCPFCKSPCSKTDINHCSTDEAHTCLQHRIQGVAGVRIKDSEIMVIESCNFNVQKLKSTFICSGSWREQCKLCKDSDKEKRHLYTEYKKSFPEWDIVPSPNMDSSTYWKWFIATFEDQLVKHYQIERPYSGTMRSWRKIDKKTALESLRSVYG